MVNTETGFAQYSKTICFAVSSIWMLLSMLSFTGDAQNGTIIGFLWLAGAVAFAISATLLNGNAQADMD